MMEHVRHYDWCTSVHERYFVEEADLDNCNTEKILRNRFIDPLLSSESEDEATPNVINWDEIFKNKQINKNKLFVPGLNPVPPYPKVSALNCRQHIQFLKVLSAENPTVLEDMRLGTPMKQDFKAFQAVKETYLKEQKEYKDWAKSLWTTEHCARALRPKPGVEALYEAQLRVRARRVLALPTRYAVAAHLSFQPQHDCDVAMTQHLIRVNLADIPQVQIPERIEKPFNIIRPCTLPEPCQKHPYQFILPNEDAVTMLPMPEIHNVLAHYALSRGSTLIASEGALRCLLHWRRHWLLPLSVCEAVAPDGDKVNVVVLDSEFSIHKEPAPTRTHKAFRHLLEHALIPSSEREKVWQRRKNPSNSAKKKLVMSPGKLNTSNTSTIEDADISSDDENLNLVIDTGENEDLDARPAPRKRARVTKTEDTKATSPRLASTRVSSTESVGYNTRAQRRRASEDAQKIGFYSCTCKDTLYEIPPRRSFLKWQFKNKTNENESFDVIIHCSHRARDESGELILEPIPEYQLDLGASEQSEDYVRSIALSLALRKHATVLNVRVDGATGDVVTFERVPRAEFDKLHSHVARDVMPTLHAALAQLQGLLPGHYVLKHEPHHVASAVLLSQRAAVGASERDVLELQFDSTQLCDADETIALKPPPTICDRLLPYHKQRKVLPCAFTPYENQLVKEPKKPPPKNKQPPRAIKWPKRKRAARKKR